MVGFVNTNEFTPHSMKQQQALLSKNKILLLAAGTQWGKTQVGALRMKIKIHENPGKDNNFLITSPTYKTLHQSTLPAFLKYMEGMGSYDKKFDTFNVLGGGIVYCRTETDPDSIVGITNTKHIWGDEAGKYGKYFWENMQARAEFCGCGIDLTTSPYSLNWVYREIIKPYLKGLRPDVDYITAASWENPFHSLSKPENKKLKESTMDERRFRALFGGVFEKMEGLVYDLFDEESHIIDPINLPTGTKYYCGVDWGYYPDPFVLSIRAVTPNGNHYKVSEFVKTRMTINDQVCVAKQKQSIYNIERFIADPSRPDAIEEFNRNRLTCIPAINDIRIGIDKHYDLIKSGRYKVFKNNQFTIDEYSSYHYPDLEDLGPDDDQKEQLPVDQSNHVMDTERYLTMNLLVGEKKQPKVPSSNDDRKSTDLNKRLAALKRLKNYNTENW